MCPFVPEHPPFRQVAWLSSLDRCDPSTLGTKGFQADAAASYGLLKVHRQTQAAEK